MKKTGMISNQSQRGLPVLFLISFTLVSCNLGELRGAPQGRALVDAASTLSGGDGGGVGPSEPVGSSALRTPTSLPSASSVANLLQLSDAALFDQLVSQGIGECYIQDARQCPQCFCEYYLKSKIVPWLNKGWPVNPASQDSTGCISSIQWGGYTPDMATADLIHNGAAQARDALMHPSDPCAVHSPKDL